MNSIIRHLFENVDPGCNQEEDEEVLDELQTTTSAGDYVINTPNAFSKTPASEKDKERLRKRTTDGTVYTDAMQEKLFKKIEARINELSYKDFVGDESKSNKTKINDSINQMNSKLHEIEMLLKHSMKFKKENNADQSIFWKSTVSKFSKISERLLKMSYNIREFSK